MISELRRALMSGDTETAHALVVGSVREISELLDCAMVTCRAADATGYRGLGVMRLQLAMSRLEGKDVTDTS